MLNQISKTLLLLTIFALIIVLIYFFINLFKLINKTKTINTHLDSLNSKVEIVKKQKDDISTTTKGWKFFISIFTISSLIKEIIIDHKKNKRKISKSIKKTCTRNIKKLTKLI